MVMRREFHYEAMIMGLKELQTKKRRFRELAEHRAEQRAQSRQEERAEQNGEPDPSYNF